MILLLALACAGPPEGLSVVDGLALDLDGAPLAASLTLVDAETGAWLGEAEADDQGAFTLSVAAPAHGAVALWGAAEGRRGAAAWSWLDPGADATLAPLRLGPDEIATARIQLLDATTGAPVPHAAVVLREGWDTGPERRVIAAAGADAAGVVTVSLPAGVYTATAEAADGYVPSRFPVRVGASVPQTGLLAPDDGAALRAALVWTGPDDLDLHLTGPRADGGQFHVWAEAPVHPPRGEPIAAVELEGAGQEAIAAVERVEGRYTLHVVDARYALLDTSAILAASDALVQLWWAGGSSFARVNPQQDGTAWAALTLDADAPAPTRPERYSRAVDPEDGGSL
ncbi:MAG: hypothetical protein H6739_38330 [Alphaproteobacteria bacterium]|nr:hypothetical protein [Alphaproteobacteria bacterium]